MDTRFQNNKLYIISALIWVSTIGLWVVFWFFNPYSSAESITIPGMLMLFLATLGIAYSYYQKPVILLVLALLSFLPIGLYLLGTPGIFLTIGILNILCIVIAIRLVFTQFKGRVKSIPDNG